jgi:DNA gyrase/topoisomerase IV subunit B
MTMAETPEYDDDIQVLTGLEAIRIRPQVYLKGIEIPDGLIIQTLCHAIDEVFDGKCSWIKIEIDRELVTIEYNAGISLEIRPSGRSVADLMMTELYACHNLKKHLEVGEKYCRLGLAAVTAFCDRFEIETVWHGKIGNQIYIKGAAEQDFAISNSPEIDKTKFIFVLDRELVGDYQFDFDRLRLKLLELAQELNIEITIA